MAKLAQARDQVDAGAGGADCGMLEKLAQARKFQSASMGGVDAGAGGVTT